MYLKKVLQSYKINFDKNPLKIILYRNNMKGGFFV